MEPPLPPPLLPPPVNFFRTWNHDVSDNTVKNILIRLASRAAALPIELALIPEGPPPL